MKRYMLIWITDDGHQGAFFTDSLQEVQDRKMNCECGMGWYSEVYHRVKTKHGNTYRLWYS